MNPTPYTMTSYLPRIGAEQAEAKETPAPAAAGDAEAAAPAAK